jgi:hypothetical protein
MACAIAPFNGNIFAAAFRETLFMWKNIKAHPDLGHSFFRAIVCKFAKEDVRNKMPDFRF